MSKWEPNTYANEKRETLLVDRYGQPLIERVPRPVGFRVPDFGQQRAAKGGPIPREIERQIIETGG